MDTKVFLIQAPLPGYGKAYQPPLELGYLASYLRREGYDVLTVDAGLHAAAAEVARCAQGYSIAVILAPATRSVVDGADLASLLRAQGLPSAVWGTVPDVYPRETLESYSQFEFILRGDPEPGVLGLLRALGGSHPLTAVPGLVYRDAGRVVAVEGASRLASLDDLPWPARDLLQLDRYPATFQGPPHGHLLSSRGCYYQCTFCGARIYGPFRTRSAKDVVDEMEHVGGLYGVREFAFRDLTFGPAGHIRSICNEIIARGLAVHWYCLSHPAILTPEVLQLMKDAGCRLIDLGVESGDQSVLDRYRKGTTVEQIRAVFARCRHLGIETQGNVLLGGPYDTPETIRSAVRLLEELNPPLDCVTRVLPIPGTPLYDEVKGTGRLTSLDWSDYHSDPYDSKSPAAGLISHDPDTERALEWAFLRLAARRRRAGRRRRGLRLRGAARRLLHWITAEAGDAWRVGVVHVLGSEGIGQAAGLVTTMALAGLLGAEAYGHLGVINAVMALAAVFATFGLAAGVTKYVSQDEGHSGSTLATAVRLGLLTSLLTAVGLFVLTSATAAVRDVIARSYLRWLAWSLPLTTVGALGLAFLYGLKRLRLKATLKAALDTSRVGLLVGGAWLAGLPGVVAGKVIAALTTIVAGLAATRGAWRWQERCPVTKDLLRFSGFSFLGASFSTLLVTTDTLTISTLLGSPSTVGHYRLAALMAMALTMPAGALAHVAFPYVSERQQRLADARRLISRLMRRTAAVAAATCAVGVLAGGPALRILFGAQYSPSADLFRVLVIAAFLRSIVGLVGTSIHALGRPDVNLGLLLITGSLNIALNILLVRTMGAAGAAWATNLVSALNLALGWWALRHMILRSRT